jgi:hypothetical protein
MVITSINAHPGGAYAGFGGDPGVVDITIVTGGQTGVDRAALDVALALGIPYGGWCPAGGWAEDLPVPPGLLARYPSLRPAPPGPASTRTAWNVRDSDATLVLALSGRLTSSPGTLLTVDEARRLGRPHLVADVADPLAVSTWLASLGSRSRLNVAGPRESEQPGLYAAAHETLRAVLDTVLD